MKCYLNLAIAAGALAVCLWAVQPAIAQMGGGRMGGGGMGGGGMAGGCMGANCMGGGMAGGGMGGAGMGNPGSMGGGTMGSPGNPGTGNYSSGTYEPGQRPRRTAMGRRAHDLAKQVDAEITTARGRGQGVNDAEQLRAQGDSALAAGHYRIAVERYEAARKSLNAGGIK